MRPVAGTAVYDVVRTAAALETAIWPGNVHSTRAVDGGGRKARAAKAARLTVAGSARNAYGCGPALAAVGGHESRHATVAVEVSKSYYDITVGLYYGIHTNTVVSGCCTLRWAPGQPAVGGGGHLYLGVVPPHVAISVIGAGGRVIAIDPVLVCVAGLGNVNRVVPMHTIFGAADGDVHTACNGQGVNQPHTMFRVVSDGCVTGGRVAATLIPLGKAR